MSGARIDLDGLGEVHALVLRLLAELDRVATAEGMPYFLAYGTAIGAVREHDLIAWDADADVWLHHDHHGALLERIVPALGPDFELLTAETHDDYEYLFPRLTLRGVHHAFVRLDIFPLDPAPRTHRGRALYRRAVRLLDRAYFVKRADLSVRGFYSARKRAVTRVLRLALLPVPAPVLRRAFRRLQARGERDVLVNSCGSYGERELMDAAWFTGAERVAVRDLDLPVPAGYDALLTQIYGDYRTPVSREQQQRELRWATDSVVAPMRSAGLLTSDRSS